MKVTKDLILHIANLAHLNLREDEIEKIEKDLNQILEYVNKLNEIDTTDVLPLSHPIEIINIFRDDIVGHSIPREEALKNAPDSTDEFFKVPKVI